MAELTRAGETSRADATSELIEMTKATDRADQGE